MMLHGARKRESMVRLLVRWGGEQLESLAYKNDVEIEDMVARLKHCVVETDSHGGFRICANG